jgi:hypothetical protein
MLASSEQACDPTAIVECKHLPQNKQRAPPLDWSAHGEIMSWLLRGFGCQGGKSTVHRLWIGQPML